MKASGLAAIAATVAMICAGCAAPTPAARPAVDTPQRPGTKTTCPEALLSALPKGSYVSERNLVGFGPTLLGVESTISAAGRSSSRWSIDIVSGGYVDDLTEPYDDLQVKGTAVVAGEEATVLSGSLLETKVWVAIWHQRGTAAPCDVHSIASANASRQMFEGVLRSVRVRQAVTAAGSDGGQG